MELGHEGQYRDLSWQQAEYRASAACLGLEAQSGWKLAVCYVSVTPRQHSTLQVVCSAFSPNLI